MEKEKEYKLIGGTGKDRTMGRLKKELICFLGENFRSFNSEFVGEKLDEKIKNGQDCYVIFEKESSFPLVYFQEQRGSVDEDGKQELA